LQTPKHRGFSLLELLIVIAIIGILSTVVIASLNSARRSARNEAVITQMHEYQKAFELSYSDTGMYPDSPSTRTGIQCFGEGMANNQGCIDNYGTPYTAVRAAPIHAAIYPKYLSNLPRLTHGSNALHTSPAYSGCSGNGVVDSIGNSSCTNSDYSLWFMLEGVGQDCGGRAYAAILNVGGMTICRLSPK
jgi:general secretion pathway protein G